jgi:hypothetical protein
MHSRLVATGALLLAAPGLAVAQNAAPAPSPAIPLRETSAVLSRTDKPLGGVSMLRSLSDGSLGSPT